jgi:hypothetical protein
VFNPFNEQRNWVLWFVDTIREFGGEYIPFRDFGEPAKITGRRADKPKRRPLNSKKYFYDGNGSVRRIKDG